MGVERGPLGHYAGLATTELWESSYHYAKRKWFKEDWFEYPSHGRNGVCGTRDNPPPIGGRPPHAADGVGAPGGMRRGRCGGIGTPRAQSPSTTAQR